MSISVPMIPKSRHWEEIAMDNEQIASRRAEKQAIRRSRMNRKNGIPRRRTDMRGSGELDQGNLVKRSIHAPYVWRNSQAPR